MLNENQLYNNKLKFLELLGKLNIDLTQLVKYLDTHDYFNKPASSQYFRPYAGGLCQYALDLYYELAQLVNAGNSFSGKTKSLAIGNGED